DNLFAFVFKQSTLACTFDPAFVAGITRINVERQAAAWAFAVCARANRRFLPKIRAGARIAEVRARVVKTFLNVEDFQTRSAWIEVGQVQRVAVPQPGRI